MALSPFLVRVCRRLMLRSDDRACSKPGRSFMSCCDRTGLDRKARTFAGERADYLLEVSSDFVSRMSSCTCSRSWTMCALL